MEETHELVEILKHIGVSLGQIAVALNAIQVKLASVVDDDTPPQPISSSGLPRKAVIRSGSVRVRQR